MMRYSWPWLKAEFRWRVLDKRYDVRLSEEAQVEIRKTMERISRNPYSGDRIKVDEEVEG